MTTRSPWTAGVYVALGQVVQPRTPADPTDRFDYVAQHEGTTGTTEPAWPTADGQAVNDGSTVIWKCVEQNVMTWTAVPLYKSGASEPVWPTAPGSTVVDGTVTWATKVQNVEDANCPNTDVVLIAGSKVYAKGKAPGDVVRYSGTNRPLDWTTANDAGFLATGLQMQGDRDCTALAEYRARLVVFSASTALIYDIDPDPSKIALFDNFEGLGCQHPRGPTAVADDLYFPTAQGVRTLTYAANFDSLSAGDAASAIDPLIAPRLAAELGATGFYYPGAGQYWLVFNEANGTATAYVYTTATAAKAGGWSRYTYPWPIDDYTISGGTLAFRSGSDVYEVNEAANDDAGVAIPGLVQWAHLDFGNLGVTKQMIGLDLVGTGAPSVSIGYDQNDPTAFTPPYAVPADTLTGQLVPFPLAAPSIAVRLTYAGAPWSLQASTLYLQDLRLTA